jgi:hypothetical protein
VVQWTRAETDYLETLGKDCRAMTMIRSTLFSE